MVESCMGRRDNRSPLLKGRSAEAPVFGIRKASGSGAMEGGGVGAVGDVAGEILQSLP